MMIFHNYCGIDLLGNIDVTWFHVNVLIGKYQRPYWWNKTIIAIYLLTDDWWRHNSTFWLVYLTRTQTISILCQQSTLKYNVLNPRHAIRVTDIYI